MDERTQQVSLMGDIYKQAMQTAVWLGEADEASNMAMDFALLIHRVRVKDDRVDLTHTAAGIPCRRLEGLLRRQIAYQDDEIAHPDLQAMRRAVQNFFSRQWFRRVWVLQEVINAPVVVLMAGEKVNHWSDVLTLASWENSVALHLGEIRYGDIQESVPGIPFIPDTERSKELPELWAFLSRECRDGKYPSILELIFRRDQLEASDRRDHVFTLFNLSREWNRLDQSELPSGFRPDYSKEDPIRVYADFTRAVVSQTNNLVVLSAVDTFKSPGPGQGGDAAPSWVPLFDQHFNFRRSLGFMGYPELKASGRSTLSVSDVVDVGLLSLRGIAVDVVGCEKSAVSDLLTVRRCRDSQVRELLLDSFEDGIQRLWQSINWRINQYPTSEPLLEAFVLTIICSCKEERTRSIVRNMAQIPGLLNDFLAYWRRREPDFASLLGREDLPLRRQDLVSLGKQGSPSSFGKRLMWTCDSRRFFMTERSYIGLCPRATRPGDKIVIFNGAKVPYVVRPTTPTEATNNTRHQLIGECYVQGLMDGALIQKQRQPHGALHEETFDLR
ncbi:hypothetical protein W97_05583 [Coniosporium apollinis CBS 100218]|uniref:Heterokaryon incompatibility domain-containing protein n=1 Tax=Coniosporium apollinis (strain CBS 100218) TaxID=1168221 RepID=R7YX30_CONA1|nr:uncharacterized protein W97_05583 [Coniosporium apollinis CBS 100218]EON66485.1 hypothetical protein W97_05583 [Coniosporium apollinis CBS 100218]